VSECLRPTPADNLPSLVGIQPAELRRKGATLSLARRGMDPEHLLHLALTGHRVRMHGLSNRDTHLYPSLNNSINSSDSSITYVRRAEADSRWNAEWLDNLTRLRIFIPDTGTHPPGMTLPRTAWVRLNRFRLHQWSMASSASCECGAEE